MSAEPTEPAAPPPTHGWQPVTPETRFEPDRYYAVLAAGEGVFLAVWDEERKGLVSHPRRDGVWYVTQRAFREDDWRGGSLVRYFCELPAVPAAALDECNGLWREYFAWLHGEPTAKNPGKGDEGGGSPEKDAEGGDAPAPVPGPNHPRLPKRPSPLQEHEPLPKPEEP
jgi:hypothetical protein